MQPSTQSFPFQFDDSGEGHWKASWSMYGHLYFSSRIGCRGGKKMNRLEIHVLVKLEFWVFTPGSCICNGDGSPLGFLIQRMHHSVDMRSQHPVSQANENLLFCSKDIKCPPKNKGISKWGWGLNLSSMLLLHLQLLKITLIGTNFKIAPAECSGCWLLSTRTVSTTAAQTRLQHIKMYSKEEGSKCCFLELFWKRNLKIASAINTQSLNHCGLLFYTRIP